MTTDRVTVDTTREPFTTKPSDLFALRFMDVGITDEQMPLFREYLKQLLPVHDYIDRIADDARLLIRDVVELVREGLLHYGWHWLMDNAEPDSPTMPPLERPAELPAELPSPTPFPTRPRGVLPELSPGFADGGGFRGFSKGAPSRRASKPAARTRASRVVNTGFVQQSSPRTRLGPSTPLAPNSEYYFWLTVGKPERGSIEVNPTALPVKHLPREPRLKVALFDFGEGLRITPGADVGEIQLQPNGEGAVVRQPAELPNISRDSKLYWKQLFFPVRTSEQVGEFRLRCNIYFEQVLVQSRLVRVLVTSGPKPKGRSLNSTVDYTLSRTLRPSHVTRLEPHRLSFMLNDNGNGTHGFRFFGEKEFKSEATFDGQELQDWITQARAELRRAAWGDKSPWQQGKPYLYADKKRDLQRLKADLINFAKAGYTFYDSIINRLTGGTDQSDELAALMRTPGLIQIALKQSARNVLPAAMIYDYNIETNAPRDSYTLCPGFLEALDSTAQNLEDSVCFKGDCPTREAATVVCPSGFWGYRHSLGIPLSVRTQKKSGDGSPEASSDNLSDSDAPAEIFWKDKPELTVGVSTDRAFVLRPSHEKALQALRPLGWNYAATRAETIKLLKERNSHLVYFYCHGGMAGAVPFIQVGPPTEMGITRDNLRREKIRWKSPRPLVFLNGCHTAALEPDVAIDFITAFIEVARACGVIGTEITIFEPLAIAFAEECLRRFLNGAQIGDSVRGSRLKLLKDGNPLGLVYIPYVIASLRMVQQPLPN
jgi:hypothetical protein